MAGLSSIWGEKKEVLRQSSLEPLARTTRSLDNRPIACTSSAPKAVASGFQGDHLGHVLALEAASVLGILVAIQ